jgi:hypothetical protein
VGVDRCGGTPRQHSGIHDIGGDPAGGKEIGVGPFVVPSRLVQPSSREQSGGGFVAIVSKHHVQRLVETTQVDQATDQQRDRGRPKPRGNAWQRLFQPLDGLSGDGDPGGEHHFHVGVRTVEVLLRADQLTRVDQRQHAIVQNMRVTGRGGVQ